MQNAHSNLSRKTDREKETQQTNRQIDKQLHWSAYAIYVFILKWFRFVWFICNVKTTNTNTDTSTSCMKDLRLPPTLRHGIPIFVLYLNVFSVLEMNQILSFMLFLHSNAFFIQTNSWMCLPPICQPRHFQCMKGNGSKTNVLLIQWIDLTFPNAIFSCLSEADSL